MTILRHVRVSPLPSSAFAGYRFPAEVIVLAVRSYLRYGPSYRDLEELLAERGIEVDRHCYITAARRRSAAAGCRMGDSSRVRWTPDGAFAYSKACAWSWRRVRFASNATLPLWFTLMTSGCKYGSRMPSCY